MKGSLVDKEISFFPENNQYVESNRPDIPNNLGAWRSFLTSFVGISYDTLYILVLVPVSLSCGAVLRYYFSISMAA